ncbi:MAG: hypothetical protein ACI9LG_001659 [Moritella dasanensis]|jgi:hypothetical protein
MQSTAPTISDEEQSSQKSSRTFIIFTILVSLLYIFFEITLNFSLVNLYSKPIAELFLNPKLVDQAHNIEMYGRIISGFGFSLLLFSFLYNALSKWISTVKPLLTNATIIRLINVLSSSKKLERLIKSALFITLWVVLVLFLRFMVETLVYQSSEKTKLDSVRSVMFKELYGSGQLNFPDLTVLNEATDDPVQKKILTALIPSLAFASPQVNKSIESKTDEIAVFLLNKREREKFQKKISPILNNNKKTADAEFALYSKYYSEFKKSNWLLSNKKAFKEYRNNHLESVNKLLEKSWNDYDSAVNYIPQYTAKISTKLMKDYVKLRRTYAKKKCYRKNEAYCQKNVFSKWDSKLRQYNIPTKDPEFWFKTSFFEFFKKLALYVPGVFEVLACDIITDDMYCGVLAEEFEGLNNRLKEARIEQLIAQYPFGLTLEKNQYLKQPAVQKEGANYLRKQGIKVAKSWKTADKRQLTKATKNHLKNRDTIIQKKYNSKSRVDFNLSSQSIKNRESFYKTKQLQKRFKNNLGKYYYSSYLPQHSDAKVFLVWQNKKKNSNLNIVKMLTHKAEYGFKPGGMFYQLGIDAVKFSIIPTVSIMLSVIGVLLISIKILVLLFMHFSFFQKTFIKIKREPENEVTKPDIEIQRWVLLIPIFAAGIMSIPYFNSYYIDRISKSLNESNQASTSVDTIKNYGLGYVLDAQSNLFKIAGVLDVNVLAAVPKSYLTSIKLVDNLLFDELSPYAHYALNYVGLSIKDIVEPDFNLTIYRKEYDLLMAMGLNIDEKAVTKVSIPTIFTNEQADVLFDSKILYGATDYKLLFQTSLQDARDPEFWVGVMHSDLLRKSMRQQLEQKTLNYITQKYPQGISSLKFLPKGKQSGNIVLVKLKRKKYDCYYLPTFNFSNLITIFSSTDLNTANERFRCKWEI